MANNQANQQQQQQQSQQSEQQQQQQMEQQQQTQQTQQPSYSIPGILHYLQYEWHKFEAERQQWEVEKAELSARIALLQGDRKAHENLKFDLVRRIKMLEYCLRMERAKYHKLKYGVDPPALGADDVATKAPNEITTSDNPESATTTTTNAEPSVQHQQLEPKIISELSNYNSTNNDSNAQYKQGRELLRHYLQEIGYTDTIIDLRSNRVRSLLGIGTPQANLLGCSTNNNVLDNVFHQNHDEHNEQQLPAAANLPHHKQQLKQQNNLDSPGQNASTNNDPLAWSDIKNQMNQQLTKKPQTSARSGNSTNDISTNNSLFDTGPNNANQLEQQSNGRKWNTSINADTEASVLANFEFLYDQNRTSKDSSEDEDEDVSEDVVDAVDRAASVSSSGYSYHYEKDNDAAALFGSKLGGFINANNTTMVDTTKNNNDKTNGKTTNPTDQLSNMTAQPNSVQRKKPSATKHVFGPQKTDIGELAALMTLPTESDSIDSALGSKSAENRKAWSPKYQLKSHFDCVRALKFHETESLLVTASEDETIKLWNLTRTQPATNKNKQAGAPTSINALNPSNSTLDLEPIYTFRGHTSRILCLALHKNIIFSGAQNGEIISWQLPSPELSSIDPYDRYDSRQILGQFEGHTDAVWSLEMISIPSEASPVLCSASSDRTIKIWDTSLTKEDGELLNVTIATKTPLAVIDVGESSPTCLATIPELNNCFSSTDLAVSFDDGKIRFYDIASCLAKTEPNTQPFLTLEHGSPSRINSIVIHPTLPCMVSAHNDRDIKFWDLTTRKCNHTMVAHLDEVTSLACDPNGVYLLSAGHDCSVRLWNFNDRTCVQELTSHRKKFDEAIFAVTFHSTLPHFATAGADGLAKVFVS